MSMDETNQVSLNKRHLWQDLNSDAHLEPSLTQEVVWRCVFFEGFKSEFQPNGEGTMRSSWGGI